MYRFQVRQRRKQSPADTERGSFREPNGSLSPIEALALASEAKGQLNGIVANVIHESLEHTETSTPTPTSTPTATATPAATARQNGIENRAFVEDATDATKSKDA